MESAAASKWVGSCGRVKCLASCVALKAPPQIPSFGQGARLDRIPMSSPKLGTIDRMYSCATCKGDIQICPGHFGPIELATPVFHVGGVVKIKKLLETVCHSCCLILAGYNPDQADAIQTKNANMRRQDLTHIAGMYPLRGDIAEDNPKKQPKIADSGCSNAQPDTNHKEGLSLTGTWKPERIGFGAHRLALGCSKRGRVEDAVSTC